MAEALVFNTDIKYSLLKSENKTTYGTSRGVFTAVVSYCSGTTGIHIIRKGFLYGNESSPVVYQLPWEMMTNE